MDFGLVIKKTITFFIEPLGIVLSLLVLGLYFIYTKKDKLAKILLSLGLGALILFSYPPFSNFLVQNLENKYPKYNYKDDIKYIHVLGSGHNTDISQPISSNLSYSGVKRVLEGVILHKRIKNSKLIFTGYEGTTNIANAIMNSKLAIALGFDEKNIIINDKPNDTLQEA